MQSPQANTNYARWKFHKFPCWSSPKRARSPRALPRSALLDRDGEPVHKSKHARGRAFRENARLNSFFGGKYLGNPREVSSVLTAKRTHIGRGRKGSNRSQSEELFRDGRAVVPETTREGRKLECHNLPTEKSEGLRGIEAKLCGAINTHHTMPRNPWHRQRQGSAQWEKPSFETKLKNGATLELYKLYCTHRSKEKAAEFRTSQQGAIQGHAESSATGDTGPPKPSQAMHAVSSATYGAPSQKAQKQPHEALQVPGSCEANCHRGGVPPEIWKWTQ